MMPNLQLSDRSPGARARRARRIWPWLACLALGAPGALAAAELDCLIKPKMYIEVSSAVDSVVETVLVETGEVVTRGQPLLQLEASIEKAKLELARLKAGSDNEIDNRKVQLRYARGYLKRMQDLLAQNSVSQYEKDKAATEVELAQIELDKAREKKRVAQLDLELARAQLALKTIRSPIEGIVVDRYAMVGESVYGRSIMKLAQIDPLIVELIAPTEYFGLLEPGMRAEIFPEQPAGEAFAATVTLVDQLIDPASGSFTVRMELPNPDDRLVAGVNCAARFDIETPAPPGSEVFSALDGPTVPQ